MPEFPMLPTFRWVDVLDVILVAIMLWTGFLWLRRTRSRLALAGVAILGGIYLGARLLGLQLTVWILQGFFAVLVIVLVVVFQEDLRRFFEQVAVWGLRRRAPQTRHDVLGIVARAATQLARNRIGALIVLPGRDPLERHLEGGIRLDALVSEPLLLSLFDPHSAGHDGAVVLAGDRVERFAVHLPLSTQHRDLGGRGTRHAAALGLSERSDALAVVVSEERGTVSVARQATLVPLAQSVELTAELETFRERIESRSSEIHSSRRRLLARWPEALVALAVAVVLWLLLVPAGNGLVVTRTVPVEVSGMPSGFRLVEVQPAQVKVRLQGPRRVTLLLATSDLGVVIDAALVELGRRTFSISSDDVSRPPELEILEISPSEVRLRVERDQP